MKINCLAGDDEPMALNLIVDYIRKTPFLHLVGQCADAYAALAQLEQEAADLIFLDIQMPGMTGVDLHFTLPEDQDQQDGKAWVQSVTGRCSLIHKKAPGAFREGSHRGRTVKGSNW